MGQQLSFPLVRVRFKWCLDSWTGLLLRKRLRGDQLANLFILVVALSLALSGGLAIVEGVVNERAERRARRPAIDRGRLADEIEAWLTQQD
jgi:hypothetical protein